MKKSLISIMREKFVGVRLIIPLTTSIKENKYHYPIGTIGDRDAFAITSQIRLIDTKRLHDRLAVIDKEKFEEIKKAVRLLI